MPRRRPELLLLLLAGAAVFFGGGFGCTPDLRGVDFRAASVLSDPDDVNVEVDGYAAFTGREVQGTAIAGLPYALKPPFEVSARFGVFVPEARHDSREGRGCIGFADRATPDDFRVCIRVYPLRIRVFSNLDGTYPNLEGEFADCLDDTHVELRLQDDGETVTASYRCSPGDAFSTLLTADSLWSADEQWDPFVSVSNLTQGGQIGFDNLHIATAEPGADPEEAAAFETLAAFQLALDAFYALEAEDPVAAQAAADAAVVAILAAEARETPDADKLVAKAASTHAKLAETLAAGGAEKFQKALWKLAGLDANALEALASGF